MAELDQTYAGLRIAIAGYGLEGESALRYFRARGAHITVLDESDSPSRVIPKDVESVQGATAFDSLESYDIVSRTPPLHPNRLRAARATTSVTRTFLSVCPAPIIGVTGTKGKGTTTSLIAAMLKNAGHTVHLVGNIGVPALDVIEQINPNDIVCYELSSFQLWDVQQSPGTAVVLMMAPDHLDTHTDMHEYIEAKMGISRFQQTDDWVIYHPNNTDSAAIAEVSPAREKMKYLTEQAAYIRGGNIMIGEHKICTVDEVGLRGAHNLENICAAVSAAWRYTKDIESIKKTLIEFTGLEHRIEFVRTLDGVSYYNDSYSSAPLASQAAIRAFPNDSLVVILGGKDKKGDYSVVYESLSTAHIRAVIVYGQVRHILEEQLLKRGVMPIVVDGSLDEVVATARATAEPQDVIVFSPGTSSYDMFKNFKERGETFKKIVQELS